MNLKRFIAKALRRILQPAAITNCKIDKKARICTGTQINDSTVGRYSYVGDNCFAVNVEVGPFCSIADNCRLGGATHPMERVSMSPVFHEGKNCLNKNFARFEQIVVEKTVIGADAWIGAGTIVISGVNIGTGAVVGAGSVVTKNVPAYEIWAGNPAHFIRRRFDEETSVALINSQWWTWNDETIQKYAVYFNNPAIFIKELEGKE